MLDTKTLSPCQDTAPLDDSNVEFCRGEACDRILMSCLENAIPAFGDWCVVELCTKDQPLREPWVLHRNLVDLTESGIAKLLHLNHLWDTADGEYSSCEDGSFLHRLAKNPEQLETLKALHLTSYVSVPLLSPNHLWGWLTLFSVQAPPGVTSESLSKAKALGTCLATALDIGAEKHKVDEMVEQKNKFVSMISHELRAPLNITMGWSSLLLEDPNLNDDVKQTVEIIYRNTREQADLISNLLDTTRIDLGKLRLEPKTIHLATFIEQNLQAVSVLAKDKGVKLKCLIDTPFARMIADPVRLHQILQNLVVNAIKFTPAGGLVTVSLEEDTASVILRVKDTGEGIPTDFVSQVFDRFKQRLNNKSYQPGLGLGLSIVRELVHAHGGEVSAHSDGPGAGSTFTVKFPKQQQFAHRALSAQNSAALH